MRNTVVGLSFRNVDGTVLFEEILHGGSLNLKARRYEGHIGGDHRITVSFNAPRDEHLYGMGEYQQNVLDLKGSTFELAHRNSQASVPFVVSSAGTDSCGTTLPSDVPHLRATARNGLLNQRGSSITG